MVEKALLIKKSKRCRNLKVKINFLNELYLCYISLIYYENIS